MTGTMIGDSISGQATTEGFTGELTASINGLKEIRLAMNGNECLAYLTDGENIEFQVSKPVIYSNITVQEHKRKADPGLYVTKSSITFQVEFPLMDRIIFNSTDDMGWTKFTILMKDGRKFDDDTHSNDRASAYYGHAHYRHFEGDTTVDGRKARFIANPDEIAEIIMNDPAASRGAPN